MKNLLYSKTFVSVVCLFFIGAGILPSISGNNEIVKITNDTNLIQKKNGPSINAWEIIDTVGQWHFHEGSGNTAYDSSGHENHGGCHGTQWTTDTPMTTGYALHFFSSTNSYVGIEDDGSLDFNDLGEDEGIMIDFWMKKDKTPSGYAGLVAKIYSDGGYSVIIRNNNHLAFHIHGEGSGVLESITSETTIDDTNQWHHIVCVWCEGTMYLYIDNMNKPDATRFIGNYQIGNTYKWLDIGNDWPTDNENPFDGFIDEVSISIIIKKLNYKTTIILGSLTNVHSTDEYITFDAVRLRCIQFFPYQNLYMDQGEQIKILKDYIGIITLRNIIVICNAVI